MKGNVLFGADEVEGGFKPFIEINHEDYKSIIFTSNVVCATAEDTKLFCEDLFGILCTGEKKNLRFMGGSGVADA